LGPGKRRIPLNEGHFWATDHVRSSDSLYSPFSGGGVALWKGVLFRVSDCNRAAITEAGAEVVVGAVDALDRAVAACLPTTNPGPIKGARLAAMTCGHSRDTPYRGLPAGHSENLSANPDS
jgi:hypothetical protein